MRLRAKRPREAIMSSPLESGFQGPEIRSTTFAGWGEKMAPTGHFEVIAPEIPNVVQFYQVSEGSLLGEGQMGGNRCLSDHFGQRFHPVGQLPTTTYDDLFHLEVPPDTAYPLPRL